MFMLLVKFHSGLESQQALLDYRSSALAKSIPPTYAIGGAPRIEILEVLFPLRS